MKIIDFNNRRISDRARAADRARLGKPASNNAELWDKIVGVIFIFGMFAYLVCVIAATAYAH